MFILNPPYISELLKNTIRKNGYSVVINNTSLDELGDYQNFLDDKAAKQEAELDKNFKLYVNSEDSIEWIAKNLSFTDIPEKINLFKDKFKFRELLKDLYPDFYYKETTIDGIKRLDKKQLKYPFIIKPAVGFLSFGVYPVKNEADFDKVLKNIDRDIDNFKGLFPAEVVDTSKFLIEELAGGEEYAIDAYYNSNGEAVILNIFHHPFFDENDVSDRVYYTSKDIIVKYLQVFEKTLDDIGKKAGLKNFPMHFELRMDGSKIVPIEINPMRFAGWCDTDLAYYAYGINVYEYYMEDKKPDWNSILKDKHDEIYYFTGADTPMNINRKNIKNINYEQYLSNIENPLEVRKTDFRNKPLFAIVFGQTKGYGEIKNLLSMDLSQYIEL